MAIAFVAANPEPKADPKADPKAAPQLLAYTPSSYVYERSYHGNLVSAPYVSAPYVSAPYVSAPLIAASPYAAYSTAPLLFR